MLDGTKRMDTGTTSAETKFVGVRGWLLFLCLCLTIFGPLAAFTTLHTLRDNEMYFSLGLIVFSIVTGVFLWCRQPVGVLLAKTYFITVLVVHGLAIVSMVSRPEMSQEVFRILLNSPGHVAWLLYMFQSKRVRATYSPTHHADAQARLESARQAIQDEIKSVSPGLWIVIAVVGILTILILFHVFGSSH